MPMNIPVPDYNTPLGFQNYTLFTFFFVERSIGLKISATLLQYLANLCKV